MQRRIRGSATWWLTRVPGTVAAALLCGVPALAGGSAAAATAPSPARAGNASPSADNWPMFHLGPSHQGWAENSSVTTANAANLGVKWQTNLYGAAIDSPMVAYDSTLKERLAYVGTQNGDLLAINMANGNIVWSVWLGSEVRASPVVANGAVFAATYDSTHVYKVNAATGAIECTFNTPYQIEGSGVAVTPKGGVPTVYFAGLDTNTASGPVYAFKQSNCAVEWTFKGFVTPAGSWSPLAYAVDATGTPLLLLGSDNPDSTIYAVNAVTGKEVWHYRVYNPPPNIYDVGAGVVVTPPGVNGFKDGIAYDESKLGYMYALNLTTGAKVWDVNYAGEVHSKGRNISTAARSGTNLVLGDDNGLVDLNPLNGKVNWSNHNPADTGVDSSPAIAGPAGSQVVAVGDLAGGFDVDSLATGAQVYHYQTGGYITSSPAVSGGDILIGSANGYLYDFAAMGGNETTEPTTTVTSPADSSQVANPNGNLTVTGKATDGTGIAKVMVAVQESGPEGQWWDAATGQWGSGPVSDPATVASPGGTSSGWTFSYPIPSAGGAYQVTASTISTTGQAGGNDLSNFAVLASTTNPQVKATPRFVAPGATTMVSGSGFGHSETVKITMLGKTMATATTTASGALPPTAVTIPLVAAGQNSNFGPATLLAKGMSSGDSSAAAIIIANKWAQAGYDATHTGYEPNDANVYNSVAAGAGTYMNLSWAYQSGAAVSAGAAVANTIAYTADHAGHLVALDVHNGAPVWTWTLKSGAALDGSPAVDTSLGLVFVGANDGTLHAISTTTGKTVWSATIGGDVFAPVYGSGHVYVTTSTGVVEAVGETNGKKLWSMTLPHPASTAPSLDASAKLLFVGESNGDVKALSTAGAGQWTYSSGSAVTTPPTVSGGTVYFGAGDSVYAIQETKGSKIWSHKTGGTIGNSVALQKTGDKGLILLAGSADGNLYGLDATKGTDLWKTPLGSPVTGVASAYATYVCDTSTGLLAAGRITSGERLWKYTTTAKALSPPAVADGTVYAGGQDGDLYSFTSYGQPPA